MARKKKVDRGPLPYSAFPADLAEHIGAMTVAYQRIEDEVPILIANTIDIDADLLNVFLSRVWQISARLQILNELAPWIEEAEGKRLKRLAQRIIEVGADRNEFVHSASVAYSSQTGEVFQLNRKKKGAQVKPMGQATFELLINRMYLILEAIDQRHYDVDDWDDPLKDWAAPIEFWKRRERAQQN